MRKPTFHLPFALASISALGLWGCATAPHGPGMIDPRMAQLAQSDSAREMELVMDAGGAITKISVNDSNTAPVPEALRKLTESTFPGSTITESEVEIYADAGMVNEVEVKTADGKECEVSMNSAGALRYTECQLLAGDLPAPVAQGIAAAAPNPEITEAEIRKAPDGTEYRIEAKSGSRKWYLRFRADGTLIARAILLPAELRIPIK